MSANQIAVVLEEVSKVYRLYDRPIDRLKEALQRGRRSYHRELWALRNVTLAVEKGTTIALVGANGSGKSTLLQLVAGILQPTGGSVCVHGRVAALLELGAGFNPEHTGRENAYISGAILGIDHREMKARLEDIIRFADIGEAIDRPVKTYSTGMYIRLAFAVAINVDPEILLIDEALAVGDLYFQHRCLTKISELQAKGKTILFVSHDPAFVVTLASRAAWLHEGTLLECGNPEKIVSMYMAMVSKRELRERRKTEVAAASASGSIVESGGNQMDSLESVIPNVDLRYGNRKAKILGLGVYDDRRQRIQCAAGGQPILIRISALFAEAVEQPVIGFLIKNRLGLYLTGTNTMLEEHALPPQAKGSACTIEFGFQLPQLSAGNYSFTVAICEGNRNDIAIVDWIENAYVLEVLNPTTVHGLLRIPCAVEIKEHGLCPVELSLGRN